jgi:glutamine synthetase
MMIAGLDGIQNKMEPPAPLNVDIYELSAEEKSHIQSTLELGRRLDRLENDHEFLLRGGVFSKDLIESYIDIKRSKDVVAIALRPHPYEFFMYYDA